MSQERFRKKERVIFRRGAQWYDGRITSVNSGDNLSYVVQEFDPALEFANANDPDYGRSYTIQCGHENIRSLPPEKSIAHQLTEAIAISQPPIFNDPFSHLYMPDGRTDEKSTTMTIKIVSFRRKIVEGCINNITGTPSDILRSFVTEDRNVLREMAQTDSSSMLLFADLNRFACLPERTITDKLYVCAATGMSEDEFEANKPPYQWEFCYPMGNGEALTACAHQQLVNLAIACQNTGLINLDRYDILQGTDIDYDELLQVLRTEYLLPKASRKIKTKSFNYVQSIAACLSHAIRRDWISPFAIKFAKALGKHPFWEDFSFPYSVQLNILLQCDGYKNNEIPHPMKPKLENNYCSAADVQLEYFAAKATELFLTLPVKATHGPGPDRNYLTDIHVEYRQLPEPPHRFAVSVFHCNKFYYSLGLPHRFTCTPFSQEAIEFIWGCVVFSSMHRGDFRTGDRIRPAIITFPDRHNDRLLASYVKKAIGGDASGTEIQLVDTRRFMIAIGNEMKSIRQHMDEAEMGTKSARRNGGWAPTSSEQASDRFYNWKDVPIEELFSNISNLKKEGDTCALNGRVQAAQRCYTEAIDDIKTNASVDKKVLIVLGTLLRDRATCFLALAEGMSLRPAITALKKGLVDCETALLTKSCMRVLPLSFKKDIEEIKSILAAKIQSLSSQVPDLVVTQGLPSPLPSNTNQRRTKKGSKKQRKKQKMKQRRRQRQQQNRKEEKTDSSNKSVHDDEDARGTISIATGSKLWESEITPFVNGKDDTCPCCFDRFSVELDDVFCVVNPCGHASCLPCLSVLMKKSQKGSDPTAFKCPVCRVPINKNILTDAVDPIVSCTPCLEDRIVCLPLKEPEANQVVKELCLRHDFKIPVVLSALDVVLTDGLQASLRSSKNLTTSQKQEIYEEARAPVDVLWDEAKKLQHRMGIARDLESESYLEWKKRLNALQTTLIPVATKKAVDFIWEKMNSAGSMGIEDRSSGEIEIDFHALHVNEAKERFHEQVLPILPAVESVLLVVGRGNHSEGGTAKLGPALKKLIENHSKMRHSRVEGNDGMIRVQWLP